MYDKQDKYQLSIYLLQLIVIHIQAQTKSYNFAVTAPGWPSLRKMIIAHSLSGLGDLWRRDTSSASRLLLARLNCWLFTYLLTSLEKNQRFGITMSLVTCSKIVRPCLSVFRPAADPSRLNRCKLFSSLQKRSNFVAGRLLSRHYWKGNPHRESGWPISDNGLVILGFSLLGSTLLFVSMRNIFFVFCLALPLCPYVPVNDHFQTRNT